MGGPPQPRTKKTSSALKVVSEPLVVQEYPVTMPLLSFIALTKVETKISCLSGTQASCWPFVRNISLTESPTVAGGGGGMGGGIAAMCYEYIV